MQQTDKNKSQNLWAVRPFEPRSGEILVEQPIDSAGYTKKSFAAFTLDGAYFGTTRLL